MGKPIKTAYTNSIPTYKPGDYRIHEVIDYNFKKNKEVKHYIVQKCIEIENFVTKKFLFIFERYSSTKKYIWIDTKERTDFGAWITRRFSRKEDAQKYINYLKKHGK